MSGYETRVTKLHIIRTDETVATEYGLSVAIADDGAGEYIVVRDMRNGEKIVIDCRVWPALLDAIDRLIGDCRE